MATIEELIVQLKAASGVLVADRDRITREIERVEIAISALSDTEAGGVAAIPLIQADTPKATPKAKDGRAAIAAERATCPECGKEMSRLGIGTHRSLKHGVSPGSALPAHKAVSTPAPTPRAAGHKVLACTECDATFGLDQMGRLNTHCVTAHKRAPLREERQPVIAGAAAA